jgi:hypothetical protein
MDDDFVAELRDISTRLEASPNADTHIVRFPGWDDEQLEDSGLLIKRVARAILADGVMPDEGTDVSYQELASLLRYIADMME